MEFFKRLFKSEPQSPKSTLPQISETERQSEIALEQKIAQFREVSRFDKTEDVPPEAFQRLFEESGKEYVFETSAYPADNSGGYEPKYVWFIRDDKTRVRTEMRPGGDTFLDDIIYPSYLAQVAELSRIIGHRNSTFDEKDRIELENGFSIRDPNSYRDRISRIKILPADEAKKYKGSLWAFTIGPEDIK